MVILESCIGKGLNPWLAFGKAVRETICRIGCFHDQMHEIVFFVATLVVYTYICAVMKIEEEIKQKAFASDHQKAHINVLFTSAWLSQQSAKVLKPYNISWQQFNILRILKGMHPEPATVKLLTERMIDKMSNASRLVEKLKQKGLVDRKSCQEDRRRVNVIITEDGLGLIREASLKMDEQLDGKFRFLSEMEAQELNRLLDKMRG